MLQPQISNFVHTNELLFCILAKVIVNSRLFHPKFKILVNCCKQCITLPDAARGPLIWCCNVCQYPIKQTLCAYGLTHMRCITIAHELIHMLFVVTNSFNFTVVPNKSDSDALFCLRLLGNTLVCTLHLS